MKIIVTGANGQLGSEIKEIAKQNPEWTFTFTDIDTLDLSDTEALDAFIQAENPGYIVNCAAYTAVDKAETDTESARLVNAVIPGQIARLSKKYDIRLVHVSTDYVFSGKFYSPLKEEDATSPESEYGKTKLEGEHLVMENTDAVILRTSWLYSRFGNNFVKSMLRLGADKDKLGVVFDQTGTPTNAADLAETIVDIIKDAHKESKWHSGIYHYSNEGVCSWYDFAMEIMAMGQRDCIVLPIESHEYPVPAPRPSYSVMNKKKIKTTFGIEIPHWKDSLKGVVEYLNK